MKKILLTLFFYLSGIQAFSQTVHIPLSRGGEFDGGTILSIDVSDGTFRVTPMIGKLETFEESLGITTNDLVPTATSGIHYEQTNNSLYITLKTGARPLGSTEARGSIIRYDISSGATTLIKEFAPEEDGLDVFGQLAKINNKLYGVTANGGEFGFGTIFSIDLADDSHTVIHSFNGTTDGGKPSCQLFASGNLLYGGGIRRNGGIGEVYFSYNVDTDTYTSLYISTMDADIILTGVYERDNTLFITRGAGIHKLDLSNPAAGLTVHFSGLGPDAGVGAFPYEFTRRNGDGNLYTVFRRGGSQNKGGIGRVNNSDPSVTNVHSFLGGSSGEGPTTKLTDGLNGDIYGTTFTSETGNGFILFKLNAIGVYTILHEFSSEDDGLQISTAPVLVGGKLYGIAERFGPNNSGSIWSYDLASATFEVEEQLGFVNGKTPLNGLSLNPATNTLDFVTFQGGERKRGTLNAFYNENFSYTKVADFTDTFNRVNQISHKPFYYDGKTYVMVRLASGAIITNESLYALFEFDASNGSLINVPISIAPTGGDPILLPGTSVQGNIIQENNMLYGTSVQHLWKIDLSAQTYTTLHSFTTSTDGNSPAAIILNGDKLYGINDQGGANGQGTVFSYDLTNDTFSIVEDTPTDITYSGLVFDSNKLFTVKENSTSNTTTMGSMDLSSGSPSFSDIATFDASTHGSKPGPFLSEMDSVIYGVFNEEAANGLGGLFKFDISDNSLSQVLNFNSTTGHYSFNSELLLAPEQPATVNPDNPGRPEEVVLYPNPSRGIININHSQVTNLEVYNTIGQLLLKEENTSVVNLSAFRSGLYFIKVKTADFETTIKVIKQ